MSNQAKRLFEGGIDSFSKGSWAPFIISVIGELLMLEGPTGKSCTYISNPDEIRREGIGLSSLKFGWKENLSVLEKGKMQPIGMEYIEYDTAAYVPCREAGRLPYSCRYSFDQWTQRIEKGFSEASGYQKHWNPGKKAIWDFWAGWKYLTGPERLSRYKYNAEVCVIHVLGQDITDDQRLALEIHLGGRFLGGDWIWGDQKYSGHKVSDWPPWIPLELEAAPLRDIYAQLHFEEGLNLGDLNRLSKLDITAGLSSSDFKNLSIDEQRQAIAAAYVIEAVKAAADVNEYLSSMKRLRALQQDLNWVHINKTGTSQPFLQQRDPERAGFTREGKPHSIWKPDKEQAASRLSSFIRKRIIKKEVLREKEISPEAQGFSWFWPVVLGGSSFVVAAGLSSVAAFVWWRKRKK